MGLNELNDINNRLADENVMLYAELEDIRFNYNALEVLFKELQDSINE